MSIIGCILIAVIAHRWKTALITALVVGLLLSALSGFVRWEDIHYGASPNIGVIAAYVAIGTAAFTAETAAFFAIKVGLKAFRLRRQKAKALKLSEGAPASMTRKLEIPRLSRTLTLVPLMTAPATMVPFTGRVGARPFPLSAMIAVPLGVAGLLILALAISIQPVRDHLRQRYGFEPPKYYDKLPADTDANRIAVMNLLGEQDRRDAELKGVLKPWAQVEASHGRTNSIGTFISDGPIYEPPLSLADGFELERSACHSQWGMLDRTLKLCRSVDQSARAAEHYAYDVESYWRLRLRPLPFDPVTGKPK